MKSNMIRWVGHVGCMEQITSTNTIVVAKLEGKSPLGRSGHERENSKGKEVPLQAWIGPEGSRKLRFTHFVTTAQDGGKVVSLTHRPLLPPGNIPGTHFC